MRIATIIVRFAMMWAASLCLGLLGATVSPYGLQNLPSRVMPPRESIALLALDHLDGRRDEAAEEEDTSLPVTVDAPSSPSS
jgi:hypothetical protein